VIRNRQKYQLWRWVLSRNKVGLTEVGPGVNTRWKFINYN